TPFRRRETRCRRSRTSSRRGDVRVTLSPDFFILQRALSTCAFTRNPLRRKDFERVDRRGTTGLHFAPVPSGRRDRGSGELRERAGGESASFHHRFTREATRRLGLLGCLGPSFAGRGTE